MENKNIPTNAVNINLFPVNLIMSEYRLTGISRVKIKSQAKLYADLFLTYSDDEIKAVINDYMVYKTNKVYPSVSNLKTFMNKFYNTEYKEPQTPSNERRPKSCFKNQEENETFLQVLEEAHSKGLCFVPYFKAQGIPFGSKHTIKDGKLYNQIWDWEDAIENAKKYYPDHFYEYPTANFWEQATIARICGEIF